MYLKSVALFVAIYGRGALAALKDSCEEEDIGGCTDCTPLNTEYEPAGVGEVWYSTCCTESETSTASPPVTTTKKYCYSYKLAGYPSNQFSGQKPTCGLGNNAWTLDGQCTTGTAGTGPPYTPLALLGPDDGCPGDYDSSTEYEAGDTVSDNGVVYACTGAVQFCNLYAPDLKGVGGSYWTATASCDGTASPTANPTWATGNIQDGCPEEYDSSATYEANEQVAVTRDDGVSIMYQCKPFPESQWCNDDTYSPLSTEKLCNGETCWSRAWNKLGACDGTFSPTATPTFDPANLDGCPEEYDAGTDYEPGDKVSVTPAGEDYGKIYKCKGWPFTKYCMQEVYSPANTEKGCNGKVCWPEAWTYVGGCYGTIAPTLSPVFNPAKIWDLEGCPDEYVPNSAYEGGDYVSVPKGEGTTAANTAGVVWKCKEGNTDTWCQQEVYAPGGQYAESAWEKVGFCEGTIAPTDAPIAFTGECQFKYKLETSEGGEYVVLQAGSWVKGGTSVSTGTGGTPLDLYKAGNLVRYGSDARKCSGWPYTPYCDQFSPFTSDEANYNPTHSKQGWSAVACEDIVSDTDGTGNEGLDTFDGNALGQLGPVFASNGDILVDVDETCLSKVGSAGSLYSGAYEDSGATNPGDYFKPSPAVKGCRQCPSTMGFNCPIGATDGAGTPADCAPDLCRTCRAGTTSKIVDRESQCVCDNGATDPWDALGSQCQKCADGKKYLGAVVNNDGDGVCDECPSAYPYYTTFEDAAATPLTFKLCCEEPGCSTAITAQDGTGCYDGTTGNTVCSGDVTWA
mmetsp:Transcript_23316/g.37962  ORF Transcript_23316/g.37962 Transcript_23316/m.37962 type:complete len:793 (+) Transcript_23316:154-2532(+)